HAADLAPRPAARPRRPRAAHHPQPLRALPRLTWPAGEVVPPFAGGAMRVVPVLDLKAGRVVRGVGGRRADYRPVGRRLTDSSDPAAVAAAFGAHCGLSELYLADLDAIAGAAPALATCAALRALGCDLWVDAGLRGAGQAGPLLAAGVGRVVAG